MDCYAVVGQVLALLLGMGDVESEGLVGMTFPDVRALRTRGCTPRQSESSGECRMKAFRGMAQLPLGLDTRRRMG